MRDALVKANGVYEVTVKPLAGRVVVSYDPTATQPSAIAEWVRTTTHYNASVAP